MSNTTATLHEHAVEVDTKLAELHGRLDRAHAELDGNKRSLASIAGVKPEYVTRTWKLRAHKPKAVA